MKTLKIAAFLLLAAAPVFAEGIKPVPTPVPVEKPADSIIDQFLAAITGSEAANEAAVKKYGSATVIANGMVPQGKNPKIVKREGNCAQFYTTDNEGEKWEYTICEENGKISSFDLFFGEEEE